MFKFREATQTGGGVRSDRNFRVTRTSREKQRREKATLVEREKTLVCITAVKYRVDG